MALVTALNMTDFCARLQQARHDLGLSQTAVAARAHMPLQAYNAIERGRKGLTVPTLHKLCQVLGVRSDYLLGLPH